MTQSRIASLIASLRVRLPEKTGSTDAPSNFHTVDVWCLAMDVFFAHVYDAFESHHGACGGGGNSVLSGAGLGDDAFLAKAFCE